MIRMTLTMVLAAVLLAAPATQAATPNSVVEEAVSLLTVGLNNRRDELAAEMATRITEFMLERASKEWNS